MWKQVVILFFILGATPTLALDDATFQRLEGKRSGYNQNVDQVPGMVIRLFGNERINLQLTSCSSDCRIGLVTSNGRITELNKGEVSNPTIEATMSETLLKNLLDSSDPRGVFVNALKNGEIKISGVGLVSKIKLTLMNLLAKLLL